VTGTNEVPELKSRSVTTFASTCLLSACAGDIAVARFARVAENSTMAAHASSGPGDRNVASGTSSSAGVTGVVSPLLAAALEAAVEALLVHIDSAEEQQHPLRFIAQHLLRSRSKRDDIGASGVATRP